MKENNGLDRLSEKKKLLGLKLYRIPPKSEDEDITFHSLNL